MIHRRLESVPELFAAAVALAREERAAFLDRACDEGSSLRQELEELLQFDDLAASESFLNKSRAPLQAGADGLSGSRLGPYAIHELVGHGGMGSVYRALRVEEFDQEVAIKIANQDGAEVIRRFRSERQLLAGLSHPNIARLYDGGVTPAGKPYFVMEFVRGQRIDRWCDGHQTDFMQRVRLLLEACAAVEHANQHGIIHRDLKPANILVTDHGQVRVVDFGLARSLTPDAGEQLTATGEFIGTPSFMAPEQAGSGKAAVTPATDVYGLGAVLYHLLTGRPPFVANSPWQTLRLVQEDDPLAPSKLTAGLPRDLETICLKCLEKTPERRYSSVRALAEDLERFLHGEAVVARRLSNAARAVRWSRKHPANAALILLAIGSFVAITVLWRVAVVGREGLLRQLALTSDLLERSIKLGEHRLALPQPLKPEERTELITLLTDYDKVIADAEDNVIACARAGDACYRIGALLQRLQAFSEMADAYERAIALFKRLKVKAPNEPKYQYKLSRALRQYGGAMGSLERVEDLGAAHVRALEEIEDLARRYPDRQEYQRALAELQSERALFLIQNGSSSEGESLLRAALPTVWRLVQANPKDANLQIQRLIAQGTLADLSLRRGDPKESLAVGYECLEYCELFLKQHPENPGLLCYIFRYPYLVDLLCNLGRTDEAKMVLLRERRVLETVMALGGAEPWYRVRQADNATALGHLYWESERPLAELEFQRARTAMHVVLEQFPEHIERRHVYAYLLANLPDRRPADLELARELLRTPIQLRSFSDAPSLARASVEFRQENYQAAKHLLQEVLSGPIPTGERASPLCLLAMTSWQVGERERGQELLAEAGQCIGQNLSTSYQARSLYREASELLGAAVKER